MFRLSGVKASSLDEAYLDLSRRVIGCHRAEAEPLHEEPAEPDRDGTCPPRNRACSGNRFAHPHSTLYIDDLSAH